MVICSDKSIIFIQIALYMNREEKRLIMTITTKNIIN